jgi:hypothetical protein
MAAVLTEDAMYDYKSRRYAIDKVWQWDFSEIIDKEPMLEDWTGFDEERDVTTITLTGGHCRCGCSSTTRSYDIPHSHLDPETQDAILADIAVQSEKEAGEMRAAHLAWEEAKKKRDAAEKEARERRTLRELMAKYPDETT